MQTLSFPGAQMANKIKDERRWGSRDLSVSKTRRAERKFLFQFVAANNSQQDVAERPEIGSRGHRPESSSNYWLNEEL